MKYPSLEELANGVTLIVFIPEEIVITEIPSQTEDFQNEIQRAS